ncbi:hypothetical protein H0W32_00730 [Patescibacteria group bacterium]|nr:hypothetical protein [Patescibacteria group bacterium]
MKKFIIYWKWILVGILVFANISIWYAVYRESPKNFVTVAFLNIGQGDAIFVESPTHTQMIIDGGPSNAILSELNKVMPFYDRSIDMLVNTNPDTDHYAGFIDVLNHYKVTEIIEAGTQSDSKTYAHFENLIQEKKIKKTDGKRGTVVDLGGGAKLRILFPDHDVSNTKTNDGSLIAKLEYKNTSIMLTGDAPNETEEYVMSLNPDDMKSTVLKVGHHGSRTSASDVFVRSVNPQFAVISAGVKNRYGHPHKETTDLFEKLHIPVLGTYEKGTIIMKLDGTSIETSYK